MTNRKFLSCSVLALLVLVSLPPLRGRQNLQAQEKRFHFKIDPKTPVKDLLPRLPKMTSSGPVLVDDLTKIPEVQFQEPLRLYSKTLDELPTGPSGYEVSGSEDLILEEMYPRTSDKLLEQTAHLMAKINFLNKQKTDRFMELLIENRPDLSGLPFILGDASRLDKERSEHLVVGIRRVRIFLQGTFDLFDLIAFFGGETEKTVKDNRAFVAAMLQLEAPESSRMRLSIVQQLASFRETEATEALARLALFSEDKNVRDAALDKLQERNTQDLKAFILKGLQLALFSEDKNVRDAALEKLQERNDQDLKAFILRGLQYPWPPVAKNAADALVRLKLVDLAPDLVSLLAKPDPRSPFLMEIKGKKVPVIRELVKINHLRNCLLCHAPSPTKGTLTAAVPIPGESLSTYYLPSPDIRVRADVTYLRQDFSRMQKVPDADPWPEMQRFDFLVRTRILTEAEAKKYQAEFAKVEKNSPYRQAAVTALRALTGLDAEPTAAAWRKVLAQKKP